MYGTDKAGSTIHLPDKQLQETTCVLSLPIDVYPIYPPTPQNTNRQKQTSSLSYPPCDQDTTDRPNPYFNGCAMKKSIIIGVALK